MTEHSRRAEYIDAASRLFLVKGYKGTSVRDILSAVGDSSPSVFYYYFSSKESIYRAVIESLAVRYIERIDAILFKEQKPLDMLKDFLATFMDVLSNGRTIDAEEWEDSDGLLHLSAVCDVAEAALDGVLGPAVIDALGNPRIMVLLDERIGDKPSFLSTAESEK